MNSRQSQKVLAFFPAKGQKEARKKSENNALKSCLNTRVTPSSLKRI